MDFSEHQSEDRMHGSIFVFLKRFVESTYDYSTWLSLLEAANISRETYQMKEVYPTQEIYAIIAAASSATGIKSNVLMEMYGEFLVPDLLLIYNKHIQPEWDTYDMLMNTEHTFHGAVKQQDNRTTPPVLTVVNEKENQLMITYHSKRRMAGVAVGIIKGIAKFYQESDDVSVTLLTPVNDESVKIQVDFRNR